VGAPPRARGILSCFLRDQLYPGIRDKKGGDGFQKGAEQKIASKSKARHLGLKDGQVSRFLREGGAELYPGGVSQVGKKNLDIIDSGMISNLWKE
jgi:hypothetical protein